jgi:hypothetical protein
LTREGERQRTTSLGVELGGVHRKELATADEGGCRIALTKVGEGDGAAEGAELL